MSSKGVRCSLLRSHRKQFLSLQVALYTGLTGV